MVVRGVLGRQQIALGMGEQKTATLRVFARLFEPMKTYSASRSSSPPRTTNPGARPTDTGVENRLTLN